MAPRHSRVVWTEGARRDLDEAVTYIAEDSVDVAIRVLEDVLESANSLSTLSQRGRIVPEREDPAIREILVGRFRLLYEVRGSDVIVLGLLHQRQDFGAWNRADK